MEKETPGSRHVQLLAGRVGGEAEGENGRTVLHLAEVLLGRGEHGPDDDSRLLGRALGHHRLGKACRASHYLLRYCKWAGLVLAHVPPAEVKALTCTQGRLY